MSTWFVVENPEGQVSMQPSTEYVPKGWKVLVQTANPEYLNMPTPRLLTRLEFRRRFTMPERVALDAAPDNAELPANIRAVARTMLTDLSLADEVNLDDPDVQAGVALMVQIGILTQERATEVLG